MSPKNVGLLSFVLAIVAAILAFTAAAISYSRAGKIELTPIAGGVFLLAIAFSAWARSKKVDT